jgi:hypothetical protein
MGKAAELLQIIFRYSQREVQDEPESAQAR